MMKRTLSLLALVVAAACSDKGTIAPLEPETGNPSFSSSDGCWGQISPESPKIRVGGASVSMNVTFMCTNDPYSYFNPAGTYWVSTTPGVVSMTGNGIGGINVTGVSPGFTYIEAWNGPYYGRAGVTVQAAGVLSSIAVSPSSASMLVGANAQLTATAYNQYNEVMPGVAFTWASSNPGIATVNSLGGVTAVAPGTTTLTASASGKQGSATVTVREPEPKVTVTGWGDVRPGPSCVLRYMPELQDTEAVSYTWETSGTIVGDYGEGGVDLYFHTYNTNWVKVTIETGSGTTLEGILEVMVTQSGTECTGYPPYGI